jgi:hypothetical protein
MNLNTMVNTELHCVKLCIPYVCLVLTTLLEKRLSAIVYCHTVHFVLRIVELCSELFDRSVRMLSIMAVYGSHEYRLPI